MPPQLTRLLIIFGGLAVLFLGLTWVARPDSFGWYGHYRSDALHEVAAKPPHYVPRTACGECHDEQTAQNAAGPHTKLSCQLCHGPGDKHVEEPSAENIVRPPVEPTCTRCHQQNSARPRSFPQISLADHAGGETCGSCHVVHNPGEIL